MHASLQDELRQTRPFQSIEQEAFLALGRTWSLLEHTVGEVLRTHELTPTQYNVLRILRGAGDEGLCRAEIIERMIARVPDATRLLDRLQAAGLIERERSEEDRRFVTTRLTDAGRSLLAGLDDEVLDVHREQFGALSETELRTLLGVLEKVRRRV